MVSVMQGDTAGGLRHAAHGSLSRCVRNWKKQRRPETWLTWSRCWSEPGFKWLTTRKRRRAIESCVARNRCRPCTQLWLNNCTFPVCTERLVTVFHCVVWWRSHPSVMCLYSKWYNFIPSGSQKPVMWRVMCLYCQVVLFYTMQFTKLPG